MPRQWRWPSAGRKLPVHFWFHPFKKTNSGKCFAFKAQYELIWIRSLYSQIVSDCLRLRSSNGDELREWMQNVEDSDIPRVNMLSSASLNIPLHFAYLSFGSLKWNCKQMTASIAFIRGSCPAMWFVSSFFWFSDSDYQMRGPACSHRHYLLLWSRPGSKF